MYTPIERNESLSALVAGATVTTIEGLAPEGRLHPVQQAFVRAQAFKCGFCTPGMVTAAVTLLERTPSASEDEAKRPSTGTSAGAAPTPGSSRRYARRVRRCARSPGGEAPRPGPIDPGESSTR